MRSRAVWSISVLACVAAAAPVDAQTCVGRPSVEAGAIQAGAFYTGGNETTTMGGELALGARKVFAIANGSRSTVSNDGRYDKEPSGTAFGGTIGYRTTLGASRAVHFCPLAGFGKSSLESDSAAITETLHQTTLEFGGSVGVLLVSGPGMQVAPFVGISYVRLTGKIESETGAELDLGNDSYTPVVVGVGIQGGGRLGISLIGAVTLPVGFGYDDPTYTLKLIVPFGRKM